MRFRVASDQALLVYLGDEIGRASHEHVVKLLRLLQNKPPQWLRNLQPAYCSLLVTFDPALVDHVEVETELCEYEDRAEAAHVPKLTTVEIPVCYGGEFGPDLEDVAELHGLTPAEVIRLHSSRTYQTYFVGFAPGFAYLGDLSEQIVTPRLESPRKRVPAGSVGIAGRQTAVYPFTTPGGWRLIGRTPLSMFRADRKPMELVSISAQVRFRPISPVKFRQLESV